MIMQLYRVFNDGSGHDYLIKKEDYKDFLRALEEVDDCYLEHGDENAYYDELETIIDAFGAKRLEGEDYYIVLSDELQ